MSKKGFYVQLHLHTSDTSACGHATGAEMARACKAAGYDLIAVTDHFFNANIGCPVDMSWEDKVKYMFRGYRAAKAEGDRIGLEVIPGWETADRNIHANQYLSGPELLTYGLGEDFLLANPDIAEIPYHEYIARVNAAGGYLVHAHPYRKAHYIVDFQPDPTSVPAYEVFNACNSVSEWNLKAYREAKAHGLLMLAGSDAHTPDGVRGGGMRFSRPVHSMADIFQALREGDGQIIEKLPEAEHLF